MVEEIRETVYASANGLTKETVFMDAWGDKLGKLVAANDNFWEWVTTF